MHYSRAVNLASRSTILRVNSERIPTLRIRTCPLRGFELALYALKELVTYDPRRVVPHPLLEHEVLDYTLGFSVACKKLAFLVVYLQAL